MSNDLATVIAIALSLIALGYLSAKDPKRRRVYRRLPVPDQTVVKLAWIVVLLPGVLLLSFGQTAPFVIWFGGTSFLGCVMSYRRPDQNDWVWRLARKTRSVGRRSLTCPRK